MNKWIIVLVVSCLFIPVTFLCSSLSPQAGIEDALIAPETAPVTVTKNLLSSTFQRRGEKSLPVGWKLTLDGDHRKKVKVRMQRDGNTGRNVVMMDIPRKASVFLNTIHRTELDPKKEYLFAVQFNVKNMHYIGKWHRRPAGVRIYAYGTNNKYLYMAICGEGSTDGWVTAVLPFLTSRDRNNAQDLSHPNVFLRCYNMTGTVWFRSPMIVEKPAGVDATASKTLPIWDRSVTNTPGISPPPIRES